MDSEIAEGWREFHSFISELHVWLTEYLQPIWENVVDISQKINEAAFNAYLEAGAPYGETHEGMMRWAGELGEIERMKWEIAKIESDHHCLANLRAKVHGS